MNKKSKRKLNSRSISYIMENNNNYDDDDISYTKSNFKNIWFSIIENRNNNNNDDNKLSNNNNKHDYLKPIISFYQNHKNFEYNEPNKISKLIQKYPIRTTFSSSSLPLSSNSDSMDSFESTTSSFISNSLSSLPSSHYDDYNHHKANEFYSIFVSVITAAVFLFFIMYRWFKMNADFRKALNEQIDIQQQQQQQQQPPQPPPTPYTNYIHMNRSSRMALLPVNRWTHSYSFVIPNNRDELQATAAHLIQQLSNGEYRTARQHQEMIDRARYCLQQLKLHARLTQFQRQQQQQRRTNSQQHQHNYSTFNNTNSYRSTLHSDYSPSTSSSLSPLSLTEHSSSESLCQQNERDLMPPVPPVSITSLQTVTSLQINETIYNNNNNRTTTNANNNNINYNLGNRLLNEPPPDYDTLMIKSCSLPSYSNLNDNMK
jgi:hypothetical protein